MYFFGVDCFVLTNVVVITILSLAALFFSLTLFISALLCCGRCSEKSVSLF